MKVAASTINKQGRGVLKVISASQGMEPVLAREYQAIFKNNGKPMVIVDEDTTISLANAEFERLSGYTKKEIEGTKKWTEFVAREDRKRMKEYLLLRRSDPMLAPRCCEFRFVDRHEKIKNIVLTIGQIPGTNKSMASLQDITKRKREEVTQRADEERYKTFFENSRDAVYITTRDGTYVDANRAALDLFGYTREEMKQVKARQLYADPADAQRLQKEVENKGFAQDFEVRLRKKDGTEMDCLFTVTALRGDDGSILEYQGIARDVTERKRAEEELRESKEKYRDIFDSLLEGYFEVDLAGDLTFFNNAVSKFYGYTPDELTGLNYRAYTSPEEAQRLFQVFSEVYKTGNPHEIDDYKVIKKDGSIGIAEFSVSLLHNAAGEPIGFRGVTRDVTEKKKAQEILQLREESHRKILDLAPQGITITRMKDERHVLVNNAFCQHTGYSAEEAVGRTALELNLFVDRADRKRLAKAVQEKERTDALEIQFRAKDGTILEDLVSARIIRFQDEDCMLAVTTNVNELKKAQQSLRQSEERYRNILESIQEGYFETDLDGNYTFVNDANSRFLGYTKEELVGMNYRQHSDEKNVEELRTHYTKLYLTGKPIEGLEVESIRKDGSKAIYETSVSLMRDSEGKPIGFRGVSRDITERKQAEETLRQSEEKYRTILENITEGYFENDLRGNFTFLNDSLLGIYGYTRDELMGINYRQFMDEENARKVYQAYNKVYATGQPDRGIQFEIIRKDGAKRYLENSVSFIRDACGQPVGFRGISRDITERKKAEEALRQSEERYRTIIENIQDGYFEDDLAGNYTFVNDVTCRHLGYAKEELIGMNYRQHTDEKMAKELYQFFYGIYKTGQPDKPFEAEYIRKDGTKLIVEIAPSLIRDSEGKPIGFRSICRDVTERKRAEETLRQSEERYRTILETMQEAYYENDLAGHFTFVNDALCRHLGHTKEELIGKDSRQFQDEANAKKTYQAFKEIYRTGEPLKARETEYIRKDGTKGMYEVSASLIRDAHGKPTGFRGVSRDITERKQAEETLRQSEEKYRTILESIEDGYGELDLHGIITFCNDALLRILGYPKDELKNLHFKNRKYMDGENAEKVYQAYSEVYATGKPNRGFQYEIIAQDGTRRHLESSISLKKDPGGQAAGFQGVVRDITQRKEAEERLRQSEERYRTILETMQDAYYEVDLAGKYTFVNDAFCRNFEYTKEELIGMKSLQHQDEANAKKAYYAFEEIYRTGEPIKALEAEYTRKDGTKGTYELSVSLLRDAKGKPIGFGGITHDITERKQMEEALRQSEERYRTILENMQEAYYESDLAGKHTFVNDALCRHLGCSKEELIGTSSQQFQDETTAKKMVQIFKELYRTGEPITAIESEYISKDGTKRVYELSASLIRDTQGKPIGFRGVSRDVTERKKAEDRLQRYAAELERSNEEVKNFAYIVSHDLRVPLVNLKGYTSELRTALEVIGANFEAVLPHLIDEKRSEVAIALHEDVPEALEFIINSVSRMDSFINAILILSRLGRQDLKPEPIDMNALVKTTLETMSHQIQERGIEVHVGSLPHVAADRTAMERIMGNILSNAVKYTDPERPCRIEVAAEVNNGETIFSIRDTGRGIAAEDMHKVFAPFRRAGKQDTQGEGMGLSYVQTLVRRHGGRIWCESEPGKGTTFTFTISTTFKQGASDV